jgi:hypothetical protein
MTGHDEFDFVTGGTAMLSALLDEAWELCESDDSAGDPEDDLRQMLPGLLAQLPPGAIALLEDQMRHIGEIVAFVHRLERKVGAQD